MIYNILIGGSAGQGIETLSEVLEKILKRLGFKIFSIKDYMSRVRGGHNFIQIRFGDENLISHWDDLDGIIALNDETVEYHLRRLSSTGFVICDEVIKYEDNRIIKLPLMQTAKSSGNVKTFGSVAMGSLLELMGISQTNVEMIFREFFSQEVADQNFIAEQNGSKLVTRKYNTSSINDDSSILINGNEAVALGALAAGCKFYSAYPMTPSTSIMNYLASKMMDAEIVVEQAEDEIAAINMAIGASYAGARAMTGTSGGGFCLMVEGLGLCGILEVPLVVINVQRPGPATGFPTRTEQSDLKFVISAAQGEFPRMVIALKNPEDAFIQTIRAFNLSDKYQIPVILLSDQFLADTSVTTKPFDFNIIKNERSISDFDSTTNEHYKRYENTPSGISPRIIPGKTSYATVIVDSDEHDEYGHITESATIREQMVLKRMRKLELLKEEVQEPEFVGEVNCEVLLLAWGSTWGPVVEAVKILNEKNDIKYGALIFGDIWPLPTKVLLNKARKSKTTINIEQNATGQLASLVSEATGIFCDYSILKFDGRPISSQYIYTELREKEKNYV